MRRKDISASSKENEYIIQGISLLNSTFTTNKINYFGVHETTLLFFLRIIIF